MERDDLVSNEILPALQRGWDGDVGRTTVHLFKERVNEEAHEDINRTDILMFC